MMVRSVLVVVGRLDMISLHGWLDVGAFGNGHARDNELLDAGWLDTEGGGISIAVLLESRQK